MFWQNGNTTGRGVKLVIFGCCRYPINEIIICFSLYMQKVYKIHTFVLCAHQTRTSTDWTPKENFFVRMSSLRYLNVWKHALNISSPDGQTHWFLLLLFLLIQQLPLWLQIFHIVSPPPDKTQNIFELNFILASWPESPDFEYTANTSWRSPQQRDWLLYLLLLGSPVNSACVSTELLASARPLPYNYSTLQCLGYNCQITRVQNRSASLLSTSTTASSSSYFSAGTNSSLISSTSSSIVSHTWNFEHVIMYI